MPSAANDPSAAYDQIKDTLRHIRIRCSRMSSDLLLGADVKGLDVYYLYESLGVNRAKLVALAATPELNVYIRTLYNNQTADLVADWVAARNQLDTFITLVDANYPKSSGYWHLVQTNAGAVTLVLVRDLLTAPQVTGLRNQLDALASAANAIA